MFLKEDEHSNFMREFSKIIFKSNAEIICIDGLRVEHDDGWGLVRPSNTSPYIIFRFEADNESALERIQVEFRNVIISFRKDVEIPF